MFSPGVAKRNAPRFPVFTIGHSLHSEERFVSLLRRHNIEVVLDVRSSPYSRRAPQYHRDRLNAWLAQAGIRYSFAGKALGGRPVNPGLYVGGRASYEQMALTDSFVSGLRRIASAARSHRVALLCSEAEPLECHRFLLIGRSLYQRWIDVQHVLSNGRVESHAEGERRLLNTLGLRQSGLFDECSDALAEAYAIQASRVAYVAPTRPDLIQPANSE